MGYQPRCMKNSTITAVQLETFYKIKISNVNKVGKKIEVNKQRPFCQSFRVFTTENLDTRALFKTD